LVKIYLDFKKHEVRIGINELMLRVFRKQLEHLSMPFKRTES